MLRTLFFLLLIGLVALGAAWLVERPGDIVISWQGYRIETSLAVALAGVALLTLALMLLWTLTRFIFRLPGLLTFAARGRRQAKGYAALSRGLVAVGAGEVQDARAHAREAERLLGKAPLTLLLQAQAAQLSGDRPQAEATFSAMLDLPEARALGRRGLHIEAMRRGDEVAAHHHALEAQKISAAPWAADAVFDRATAQHDWAEAMALVDRKQRARLLSKPAANRQRAVLKTAMALELETSDANQALRLTREAVKLAPGLIPAVTLAARLLHPTGEARKAERLIEDAWRLAPHPDLAAAYVNAQPGASNAERLARARALARLAPDHAEAALMLGKAAIAARKFDTARAALTPLLAAGEPVQRPGVRICLLMAELEDAVGSPAGVIREWLGRASRAPRDAAWLADGLVADNWAPVSPVTGRLDAFVWALPPSQMTALEAPLEPAAEAAPPAAALALPPAAAPEAAVAPEAFEEAPPPASPQPAPAPALTDGRPPVPDDPGPPELDQPQRKRGWFS